MTEPPFDGTSSACIGIRGNRPMLDRKVEPTAPIGKYACACADLDLAGDGR
jgi:hypothetical protein